MSYTLPSIPYLRLSVTFRAEQPAKLPEYHGSMLRGAFGHALRRLACSMGPAQVCDSCPLRGECVYTRLFETFLEGEPPPFLHGIDRAVRPYVFEPQGGGERLVPGDPLHFDLLLFGQAVDLQGHAILALERMARGGLGAGRARFRLDRIDAREPSGANRLLFSEGSRTSSCPVPPSVPPAASLPGETLTLRFVTPLRLKVRDQLADRIRFRDLAFHMLRRSLELAHVHVRGADVDWSFRSLLQEADKVRTTAADLRWHDWERWSQRQQAAMKLGGLVGSIRLEGDVTPFLPLLRTAEILHAGKGATFGLGKIEIASAVSSKGKV